MKAFRCLVGVRHPPERVALGVRDWMAEVGPNLENVDTVITTARLDRPDGAASLVN